MKKSILLAVAAFMLAVAIPSCGGGSSSNGGSGSEYSSSESLSRYAVKWELFQVGNSPSASATFTLKISSNGNASISNYARVGYSDTLLESGDRYAELNGDFNIL